MFRPIFDCFEYKSCVWGKCDLNSYLWEYKTSPAHCVRMQAKYCGSKEGEICHYHAANLTLISVCVVGS